MSLVSAIIGSSQTSRAVGAQVDAANQGINLINKTSGTASDTVQNAAGTANNGINSAVAAGSQTLSNVNTQEQQNLNPYLQLGGTAATGLNNAIAPGGSLTNQFSFDPTQLASNPDYQFQLQQGEQAIKRAAAATGTLDSGGTLKAAAQFNQGLTSTGLQNDYTRALSTFNANRAATLQNYGMGIQAGQTATGQSDSALQNFGNLSSGNLVSAADTTGTNTINAGNKAAAISLAGANDNVSLLNQIGNAKAGGSAKQGNIWGSYLGGAADDAIAGASDGGGFTGALKGLAGLG